MAIQVGGGGGAAAAGGDSTHTDTYANIPAASNDGDLFLPSDGASLYRDTGAAWAAWGPLFPFTAPPAAGWSWVNQDTATVDVTKGTIDIHAPEIATDEFRLYVRSAPTAPYVITACLLYGGWRSSANIEMYGLCFRQSSDGKFVHFGLGGTAGIYNAKWTNPTTFSAYYLAETATQQLIWFRIEDDNSDRIVYTSCDGQHWIEAHSVGRTDFLTADEVGICLIAKATAGADGTRMTLVSWEES